MSEIDIKQFRGSYLLYRQRGKGMERMKGDRCGRAPRFRHPTRESAESEARRLLDLHPDATFIVLQEVGRVKMKIVDVGNAAARLDDDEKISIRNPDANRGRGAPVDQEAANG